MQELDVSFLYSWQKDAIKAILDDKQGRYFVIKSLRQNTGKTFTWLNALGLIALTRPGSVSMLVSPTFGQSQRCLEDLGNAYIDWIKLASKGNCIVDFFNGSRIYFKSAEQGNSLRGFTIKNGGILCVDESSYVSSEIFELLLPVVNKKRATVVLTSTPDRMSGTFYELYTRGLQNDEKIVSLNWSQYVNEVYTLDELEFYKSIYSSRRFRTEILGEFTVDGGSVFTNFDRCIGTPEDKKVHLISIDWGVGGGDYTAVVFWNKNKEVIQIRYFNDMTPGDQLQYLKERILEDRPERVVVESNSIGNVYYDMLRKSVQGITVEKFNTSNSSKCEIVDRLQAGFEHLEIKIPDDEELLRELKGFEEQTTKSGLRTYSCPQPLHDDVVMALAIGYWRLPKRPGIYSIA